MGAVEHAGADEPKMDDTKSMEGEALKTNSEALKNSEGDNKDVAENDINDAKNDSDEDDKTGLNLGERRRLNRKKRKRGAKGRAKPSNNTNKDAVEPAKDDDDGDKDGADDDSKINSDEGETDKPTDKNAGKNPGKGKNANKRQRTKEGDLEEDLLAADGLAGQVARALDEKKRKGTLSDWLNPSHKFYWSALKKGWKTIPKKQRNQLVEVDKKACMANFEKIEHPFHTVADDHCETAPEAYADVAPLLRALAKRLGKTDAELSIYDPYYCAGAVVRNLAALGFHNVYNRCEDFYNTPTPEHDVIVTNPPYSFDHVEKLLEFAQKNGKPALMLMPKYVAGKSYYDEKAHDGFLVPKKRYNYWTPKGLRSKDRLQNHCSTLGVRTSPFISFWYLYKYGEDEAGINKALKSFPQKNREPFYVKDIKSLPTSLQPSDDDEQ